MAKFGGKATIKTVNALKPGWWKIVLAGKKGRQVACTVDDSGKIGDWVEERGNPEEQLFDDMHALSTDLYFDNRERSLYFIS